MNEAKKREVPLVSVIMATYNSGKFLPEAIESIMNQTYKNFEFFIVNDGSTDNTDEIICSYAKKDDRIIYIKNGINLKQSEARNVAIRQAKGRYVAIADSDDICLPNRFEEQVEYMESHPEIGVLGSYFCMFIDGKSRDCKTVPVDSKDVLNGKPPVHQPTCMIRKCVFLEHDFYNAKYDDAEDCELWFRWFYAGVRFHNLPKVLYLKRIHEGCTSVEKIKHQVYLMLKVNLRAIFIHRLVFTWRGYTRVLEQALYLIYLVLRLNRIYARKTHG